LDKTLFILLKVSIKCSNNVKNFGFIQIGHFEQNLMTAKLKNLDIWPNLVSYPKQV